MSGQHWKVAEAPAPESLATRLHMLSRTPGATIRAVDARTLDITAEDAGAAQQVRNRVAVAADMLKRQITTANWDEAGLHFQVVIA